MTVVEFEKWVAWYMSSNPTLNDKSADDWLNLDFKVSNEIRVAAGFKPIRNRWWIKP